MFMEHLKSNAYYIQPENINMLRDSITQEVNLLKKNRQYIEKVAKAMRSKAQMHLKRNVGHIEGISD